MGTVDASVEEIIQEDYSLSISNLNGLKNDNDRSYSDTSAADVSEVNNAPQGEDSFSIGDVIGSKNKSGNYDINSSSVNDVSEINNNSLYSSLFDAENNNSVLSLNQLQDIST